MTSTEQPLTISIPLTPELAERIDKLCEEEGCTRRDFIHDALRAQIVAHEWRDIFTYGEQRAAALELGPEDVPRLIEEHRRETGQPRT